MTHLDDPQDSRPVPTPEPKGVWPPQSPPFPGALRGELAMAGRLLLKMCLRVMAGTPGRSLSSCRASPGGGGAGFRKAAQGRV